MSRRNSGNETIYTLVHTKNGKSEHIDLESHIEVKESTHSLFIAADRRHRVKNKHSAKQGGNTAQTIPRRVRSKQASKGIKKDNVCV